MANVDVDRPVLEEHGLLRVGDRWAALSPLEEVLVRPLLASFGTVVSREELYATAWPEGDRGPRALDARMVRLRRRIAPLGLTLRSVRRRGFVLEQVSGIRQEHVPRS